jgi:hypothetical protein
MSDERDDPKNWPDGAPWLNPMSDTRTDRDARSAAGAECEKSEQWGDGGMAVAVFSDGWDAAAKYFTRRIPAPSTIAVPHTPEEIWAAADVWCDLGFWDRTDLEYTPDGVLHLASNVNITADREHMPVELRPDIGVDW